MKFILDNLNIFIILFGSMGFFVALYIYNKKQTKHHLICPLKSNCDAVVNSQYSTILGTPLEVIGIMYYVFIILAYALVFIFSIKDTGILLILFFISACSALFSLYLGSLQIFIIRQICIWCFSSLIISILIVLFSYLNLVK